MAMVSFLIALLLLIVGFNWLTFTLFWYETANGPHRQRLQELSGGHTWWWLARGFAWGCSGAILVLLAFPLGWIRKFRQPNPQADPREPLIFLVHGLYHNASAWLLYRWWLNRLGFRNVTAYGYRSWFTDFERIARNCRRELRDLLDRHPETSLVLVGHSMGGLVIRAVLNDSAIAERTQAVVTLATPYQGSKLAALAFGRLGRSLAYRGDVVTGRPDPARPSRRLALITPTDNMVLPNEAGRPDGDGWTIEYTAPVSHVCLLYHRPTFRRVARFIEQAADRDKE